jgi:3-deoxy-D-manno-octulosonic-acid transferase
MLLFYNCFIRIYRILIFIAAFFNEKAKLWQDGRKNNNITKLNQSIWFHFASLGEFEQGRPVLEEMRELKPSQPIVITFFSPSGYEVRKNTPLADYVYYLPLDTSYNANKFIDAVNPTVAIFTKYEYWYHYFNQLNKRQIPLYMISAIFRPNQAFFKWYGALYRKMLSFVTRFFVQDEQSSQLLQNVGISNVTISGDTRFDRVWANAQNPKQLPVIEQFKNGQPIFIGGSTWPQDEELITGGILYSPDWKFIFAPHEIDEQKIGRLEALLPSGKFIRYSKIECNKKPLVDYQILIIDNIGMLSSLYQYADLAYIGGGFGAGIHNTLEAAAFGLPVIFGPNYERFKEARDLINLHLGFSVSTKQQFDSIKYHLFMEPDYRLTKGSAIKQYVKGNTGATDTIIKAIA